MKEENSVSTERESSKETDREKAAKRQREREKTAKRQEGYKEWALNMWNWRSKCTFTSPTQFLPDFQLRY